MKAPRLMSRLLPVFAAIVMAMLVASCAPQKQYGCPNKLESSVVE